MGYQFAGKAIYTAVGVAAVSLFMELGFSTQKWLTAGRSSENTNTHLQEPEEITLQRRSNQWKYASFPRLHSVSLYVDREIIFRTYKWTWPKRCLEVAQI